MQGRIRNICGSVLRRAKKCDMKILMIGAHQDDNEFEGGGLAQRLTRMGHEVRLKIS